MTNRLGVLQRSRILSPHTLQYAGAASGMICISFVLVAFAASGFIPPLSPSSDAEEIVKHFQEHEKGIQAGATLIVFAGGFYLLFSAAVSAHLSHVPNLSHVANGLQLVAGAVGAFHMMLAGVILGMAVYRLARPAEITQALHDLFWMESLMLALDYSIQNLVLAYTVIIDTQPKPLFPKLMLISHVAAAIFYIPGAMVHCAFTGPIAWNGGLNFWATYFVGGINVVLDSLCLIKAVSSKQSLP